MLLRIMRNFSPSWICSLSLSLLFCKWTTMVRVGRCFCSLFEAFYRLHETWKCLRVRSQCEKIFITERGKNRVEISVPYWILTEILTPLSSSTSSINCMIFKIAIQFYYTELTFVEIRRRHHKVEKLLFFVWLFSLHHSMLLCGVNEKKVVKFMFILLIKSTGGKSSQTFHFRTSHLHPVLLFTF